MKFVHVNIIARDYKKLSEFYINVFDCTVNSTRDLKGEWIDDLTGIKNVHIKGLHLNLPNNDAALEIFSYDTQDDIEKNINSSGFSHIAFLVQDVQKTADKILEHGGSLLGQIITHKYNDRILQCAYSRDIENNIVEIQSWN
jgi:predicted enzyme related to lactoylglutathione lyase